MDTINSNIRHKNSVNTKRKRLNRSSHFVYYLSNTQTFLVSYPLLTFLIYQKPIQLSNLFSFTSCPGEQ